MTIYANSFDGGTPEGAITIGNSGGASGSAFAAATNGGIYKNDRSHSGAVSAGFTTDSLATYFAWYPGNTETVTKIALRAWFWFDTANSGGEFQLFGLYDASGNSLLIFRLSASSVVRLYKNVAPASNAWAPTLNMPTGKWVRAELLADQGSSSSTGRVRAALFDGDSNVVIGDSGWVEGINLGAGASSFAHVRIGKGFAGSKAAGVRLDDVELRTNADYNGNFIGSFPVPKKSPLYRWDGSKYLPLDAYRAQGSSYLPITTA